MLTSKVVGFIVFFSALAIGQATSGNAQAKPDARKKIIVIDTKISEKQLNEPYMCKNGSLSLMPGVKSYQTEKESQEAPQIYRHGENVVGLIGNQINIKKYCIFHLAFYFQENAEKNIQNYFVGLYMANYLTNVEAINLSISDSTNDLKNYSKVENEQIEKLTKKGVHVIVAIGNFHQDLKANNCGAFPACLKLKISTPKNMHVVGSSTCHHQMFNDLCFSNTSKVLDVSYEDGVEVGSPKMSGTSQATAIHTGKMYSK